MDGTFALDNAPADDAAVRAEIDRIFAEIDRSIDGLRQAEETFSRRAARIDRMLQQLPMKARI
jgi:hypothetical protein